MKKYAFIALSLLIIGGCAPMVKTTSAAAPVIQPGQAQIAFTQGGQHPEKLLIDQINSAKISIDTAIYSFTLPQIKDAMIAAAKRGVKIRVITDRQEAANKYQAQALSELLKVGIPVKINTHTGLMHLKLNIFDGEIFSLGSFNESKQASTDNDEVLMIVHDKAGAQECEKQFDRMWEDKTAFESFKG